MKFLVVGCGSIGERHIRNLKLLSFDEIICCDLRTDLLSRMKRDYNVKGTYTDLEEALNQKIDAVLVCTPTSLHIPNALAALEKGYHVFVEKPLSHDLEGVDELIEKADKKKLTIMVGFNLRFHPNLQKIKKLLDERRVGKVICARAQFGQYLPSWHPKEDYRKGHSAQRALGGGVILDAIHELDYIRWFLGEVKEVSCFAGKLSNLQIDTEDVAEILLKFENGTVAEVHMDYIQRAYSRSCQIIGDEGTIHWDFNEKTVKLFSAKDKKWWSFPEDTFDFNDTYVEEMKHFIRCITGKDRPPVDGKEGKKILEIALAAKESAETRRIISL